MKLFHLLPKTPLRDGNPWRPWYNKVHEFVIRAENEEEARKIAHENGAYENETGRNPWLDPNFSECFVLTNRGKKGVIMLDLQEG